MFFKFNILCLIDIYVIWKLGVEFWESIWLLLVIVMVYLVFGINREKYLKMRVLKFL